MPLPALSSPSPHLFEIYLRDGVDLIGRKNRRSHDEDPEKRKLLEQQVKHLRKQIDELRSAHKSDTRHLKAALKAAHNEILRSDSNLEDHVKNDVDMLKRMTCDLHTLCEKTAMAEKRTLGPCPTIEKVKETLHFGDALGPVPCRAEQRLNEFEDMLMPIQRDLYIVSENLREVWEDEDEDDDPKDPKAKFLNIECLLGGEKFEVVDMERDIFSIFILSRNCSVAFFYPLMIACFQFFITALILIDLLVDEDRPAGVPDDNYANVPAKVNPQVACAQFASLVIAFCTVDDMITSLKMFLLGYDRDIEKANPGASFCKHIMAHTIRFIEGMCTISVSVMIIVQSDDVMDIFQNFTAVAFVSELDNLAFNLAEDGLIGSSLEAACERVDSTKVKVRSSRKKMYWVINWLVLLIFLPFLGVLLTVRTRQSNGYVLDNTACNNLDVRFGDEVLEFTRDVKFSFLGETINKTFYNSTRRVPFMEERPSDLLYQYFSHIYVAEKQEGRDRLREFNSRPVYYERGTVDPTSGKFYYCDAINSWVFTIEALYNTPGAIPEEARQECEWGWLMQSPVTSAMALNDVPMAGWNIWVGDVQPVGSGFRYACTDCSRNSDCGLTHGRCDIDSGTCNCDGNWQGFRCDQRRPYCPALTFIEYGDSSYIYTEFSPLSLIVDNNNEPELFYQRPSYYQIFPFTESYYLLVAIMYTGRRWFVTIWFPEDLEILEDIDFHGYWDDVLGRATYYYSDPTESDLPTGNLTWYQTRESKSIGSFGPFGANFLINSNAECLDVDCENNDAVCGLYGTCTKDMFEPELFGNSTHNFVLWPGFPRRKCECSHDYGGFFCEFAPYGPYSGEMYEEYSADPVSFYQKNSELEYSKYWVNDSIIENMNNNNESIADTAAVANDTSVNATSVNVTSVNDMSVNDTSINDRSVNYTRVNDTSVNDTSGGEL